jgi:hypothetical protein
MNNNLVFSNSSSGRKNFVANNARESIGIEMTNQMINEKRVFSSKFLTTNVTSESFLMEQLMSCERSFFGKCLSTGFTLEDFSSHVLFLHVNFQLSFVLEQEAALIALQEPRVAFYVIFEIGFHVELFHAKLALEDCFFYLLVTIQMTSKTYCCREFQRPDLALELPFPLVCMRFHVIFYPFRSNFSVANLT